MLTDAEMEQTATYQRIIEKGRTEGLTPGLTQGLTEGLNKGRVEGSRQLLLEMATAEFGPPPPAVAKRIAAATDPDQFRPLGQTADGGGRVERPVPLTDSAVGKSSH